MAGNTGFTPRRRGGRRGRDEESGEDTRPKKPLDGEHAREVCLRLLSHRPRTHAELAEALTKREFGEDVITEVLDRYAEVGMIDDAAFATAWVTSRHRGKGLARRALGEELRRKGVDKELATLALEQLDDETERASARELVARKLRGMSAAVAPDAKMRRLVGMLARKGYPPGVAMSVVRDMLAEAAAELELEPEE
ncbi:regulatory protein RecX [Phytomonospora endophytica]|uniref:Regulatory protein RecX n=1 Tax=Phytomonospora endophytica TaxID=714109 RepID=A0A841FCW8_9ACTN|nr:regulatory protein RecX [Phytomonospora endophytica]MBB6033644.1 regulatory protein [Phytomonospora endophytica]GIG64840.1 regulatory protein RecX [Phytomonospora endophytica]